MTTNLKSVDGKLAFTLGAILLSAIPATAQEGAPMPGVTQEHEILKQDIGTWDATVSMWMEPDGQPMVSKATEENELLGGMWVLTRFEGEIAGMPFTGSGWYGYDPAEKKYIGSWVDSMSPYPMTSKGDYDAATETMTSMAEARNPETGQMVTYKQIGRRIDENSRVFEMHVSGDDGEYWKMLEIHYTRRVE